MIKKGYKCNYLEVISENKIRINDNTFYMCSCKCGNKRLVRYESLRNGIQDCGCGLYSLDINKTKYIGKRFNELTILDLFIQSINNKKITIAKCRCSCGREKTIQFTYVKNGHTKSCGCSKIYDFDKKYKGKTYHRIKIIDVVSNDKSALNSRVKCQCHCGNLFIASLIDVIKHKRYIISCKECNDGKHLGFNINKSQELKYPPLQGVFYAMKKRCYNNKSYDYKWYGGKGIRICKEWLENPKSFIEWALNNGYKQGLSIDRIDGDKDYCPENCRWVDMKEQNRNKKTLKKYEYNGEMYTVSQLSELINMNYRTLLSRLKKMSLFEAITKPIKNNE